MSNYKTFSACQDKDKSITVTLDAEDSRGSRPDSGVVIRSKLGLRLRSTHRNLLAVGDKELTDRILVRPFRDPVLTLLPVGAVHRLPNLGLLGDRKRHLQFLTHVPSVRSHHRLCNSLTPFNLEIETFNGHEDMRVNVWLGRLEVMKLVCSLNEAQLAALRSLTK